MCFHYLQWCKPHSGVVALCDDCSHAFCGDLAASQAPLVIERPANAFHQAPVAMQVFAATTVDQVLGVDPAHEKCLILLQLLALVPF